MKIRDVIVEYRHQPLEEFDGVQFKIQHLEPGDEEYADIKVLVLDDWGNEAGFAKFASDGKDLDPRALKVHDRYRGQGFAKLIYDFMKAKGYRIIRSWDQTDDGAHFWNKNRGEDVRVWEDTETLAESLSRVAYHYTGLHAAEKILTSGEFQLSSTPGSIEQQYAPAGKHYFLSTTRTKTGGYHQGSKWRGAMFVLDGNWFNQHYKSGPIDYWGDRAGAYSGRTSEAEDRVFSAEPTIPIGGVSAVHIFVDTNQPDGDNLAANRAVARQALIAAKTRGIPAYFYDNHAAWLRQDTSRTADVSQLTGQRPTGYYRGMRRRTYIENWIELMNAKSPEQLSKEANNLRYNLNYTYDLEAARQSLEVDMSNARKPDSGPEREHAVKIIKYMQQHRLNTMADFVNHVAAKWKSLGAKQ